LNRYSSFPLQECNIGANAQSKRSQKKQEKKKDGRKEKSVRQFNSLSDESDNEVNFDLEPIELEEIGLSFQLVDFFPSQSLQYLFRNICWAADQLLLHFLHF
jgi:hypothetical protein